MIKYILILITAFIITAPEIAQAQERGRPERRGGDRFERSHHMDSVSCFRDRAFLEDTLRLDEKQIDLIKGINYKHKNELKQLIEKKRPLQRNLRTVLLKDEISIKEARSLLEQISTIEIEIRMRNIVHRVEIEKVLTDEQREKYRLERRRIRQRLN